MYGVTADTLPMEAKSLETAVDSLARALKLVRIYPKGYPAIADAAERSVESLEKLIQGGSVEIRVVRESFCMLNFEISSLEGRGHERRELLEALARMAADVIELSGGVTAEEVTYLMEIASAALSDDHSYDFASAWSEIDHIKIRKGTFSARRPAEEPGRSLVVREPVRGSGYGPDGSVVAESSIGKEVGSVLGRLEKLRSMEGEAAGNSILKVIERGGDNDKIVLFLKSLRSYDDYTFAHSVNVAVISAATARHVGFEEAEAGRIGIAALMHDIGKIYVPREIIMKTGRLTPAEWQVVKRHPVDGARLLREEGIDEEIWRVALEHHMQYDLSGYPAPKEGQALLDASHIVRIADTYDALTTKRAYRKQLSPYKAIRLMARTRGTEFHEEYFDIFLHMMGNIPIGTMLRLESGETALVVDVRGREGNLPRVRMITDSRGIPLEDEVIVDLDERDGVTSRRKYRIAEVEDSTVRDVDVGRYLVGSRET